MNSVSIPTMEPDRQYYFMNQCKTLVLEKKAALNRPLTYNIQTFGCQMNSHDSEKLKGIMDEIGYEEVDDEAADFVIFKYMYDSRECESEIIRTSRPRQDIKEQKQRHDRVSVWLHDAGATCH